MLHSYIASYALVLLNCYLKSAGVQSIFEVIVNIRRAGSSGVEAGSVCRFKEKIMTYDTLTGDLLSCPGICTYS